MTEMPLDGATVAAFFSGVALLLTAIGTLVAQLRKVDPDNMRTMETRLERAEKRASDGEDSAEKYRDKLLFANAHIFRLESLLAEHGIPVPPEEGAVP